jgi:hypothetical protein
MPSTTVLVQGDPVAVDELIVRVLQRAHCTAEDLNAPDAARTVLYIAHAFADELASADPNFDRLRFVQAATEDPS